MSRWHKASKTFLASDHPLIVEQDRIAAELKQAERNANAERIVSLCRASDAYIRMREEQAFTFAERKV